MEFLTRKLPLIAALVAIVGISVGSLALSQTPSYGAETDVDVYIPDPTESQFPQLGGSPAVLPPAAPLDAGDDGSSGAVGADTDALPAAGSGGYLNSASNSKAVSAGAIALMIALGLTGSLAWVYARK
ncbi:MAG TPA: hypothetical protein VFS30_00520 [Dehalococcoidia bacterium]|nr:hypothetical protein [Dehalococcoidia bacterium]